MRWTYDLEAAALYVYLAEGEADDRVASHEELPDGSIVDVDSAGRAVGVEVLSPDLTWDVGVLVERFALSASLLDALTQLRNYTARLRRSRRDPANSALTMIDANSLSVGPLVSA